MSSSGQSRVWDSLASVKLALTLLFLLAAGAVLGTLLPQGEVERFYFQVYSANLARLILALGLDHVFQSAWFLLLLAGLALNLIVCSVKRLPQTLKLVRGPDPAEALRLPNLRLRRELTGRLSLEQAQAAVHEILAGQGRLVSGRAPGEADKTVFLAEAGRLSPLGAYVVHLGILVLFAGGVATALFGLQGFVNILEGQAVDKVELKGGQVAQLSYRIKLDKFIFEQYRDGTPKNYQSNLSFLRDGKVVQQAEVTVNGPASFCGLTFYQSTFGQTLKDWLEVEIKPLMPPDGPARTVRLKTDGPNDVPGLGQVEVAGFNPQIRGLGPGARLKLARDKGKPPEVFWILSQPPYQMRTNAPEVIRLARFDTAYYTGLQANSDPGVWFVWVGGSLVVLGLGLAFFLSHRRIWAEVRPLEAGQGVKVTLVGSSPKNRPAFEERFGRVAGALAASLAATGKDEPA